MFSFVVVLVCPQDYTKTTLQISMKLAWRMSRSPEKNPLTFGVDPDEGLDKGTVRVIHALYCVSF